MSDAYQAALRGGLSAAMPKEAAKPKKEKKSAAAPTGEVESDGVKAAKALLSKMEKEESANASSASASVLAAKGETSDAVNDALKKGLAAAAGLDKVTKEDRAKIKAEKEKAVVDQAKSWLEGKSEEEKQAMIKKAMSGGLASVAAKPKPKKKEPEDDVEPLPTSVEIWLEKMKKETEGEGGEELSDAVKAALRGGVGAAAAPLAKTKSGRMKPQTADPIPPGVRQWIEANRDVPKWEEEAGETMTAAMYGGGIASMAKAKAAPKKKAVSEEELVPKAIQRWLDQNKEPDGTVPEYQSLPKPADVPSASLTASTVNVPPEVAKFLEEAKKEHSPDEVAAALNQLMT